MNSVPNGAEALNPANALIHSVVRGGEAWIHEVPQGAVLRMVDPSGNQAVEALFYNAHDYSDRYSSQDTVLSQRNIYLTTGARLISTANHALLTIVGDTCGCHNALGGACASESNMVLHSLDQRHLPSCRQNFIKALLEWGNGLGKRDIGNNVSFFRKLTVMADGRLSPANGDCQPGRYIELRAEMDVLVVLSNCRQFSSSGNRQTATAIEVLLWGSQHD